MSRAERTRRSNNDEIPLARRFKPVGGNPSARFRYLLYASVFVTFFSVFITIGSNSIPKIFIAARQRELQSQISEDGLLLGHYPYPEASKDDLISIYPGFEVHKETFDSFFLRWQKRKQRELQELSMLQ